MIQFCQKEEDSLSNPQFFLLHIRSFMHWGYVCRVVPFSKSRMVLKAPPPTTLIGALSYPMARFLGWPEVVEAKTLTSSADKLRSFVGSAHARLNFVFMRCFDLNRVYWYHAARKEAKTDAIALGKTYVSPLKDRFIPELSIIYVINGEIAEERLGEDWKKVLLLSSWGITRVGQKESSIAVFDVSISEARIVRKGEIETAYYFPAKASANIMEGSFMFEDFVDLSFPISDYSTAPREPFIIPYSTVEFRPSSVRLKLSDDGVAVSSDHLTVVTLKRWLKI